MLRQQQIRAAHGGTSPHATNGTGFSTLLLIVGSGIVSAFQVGEISVALPSLMTGIGISLSDGGWLLSVFALVGALTGMPVGISIDMIGARRMALAGLAIQGVSSLLSAVAGSFAWLLALRVLEGFGFMAVVVAMPSLVLASTTEQYRKRAFAILGTYMPLGVAMAMLCAPVMKFVEWPGLTLLSGTGLFTYAAFLWTGTRRLAVPQVVLPVTFAAIRATAMAREPQVLAMLFALFTAAYFSVFGFLPTVLASRMSLDSSAAGVMAALVVAINACGNLACGALLSRGVSPLTLLRISFIGIAVCTYAALAQDVPGLSVLALCVLLSFISGPIPVVLMELAPRSAPSADQTGAAVGLVMQGNNIGLLAGPAVAGMIADAHGWQWVSAWVAGLTCCALVLTAWLSRIRPSY